MGISGIITWFIGGISILTKFHSPSKLCLIHPLPLNTDYNKDPSISQY